MLKNISLHKFLVRRNNSRLRTLILGRRKIRERPTELENYISLFKDIKDNKTLQTIEPSSFIFGSHRYLISKYAHRWLMKELNGARKAVIESVGKGNSKLILRLPENYYHFFDDHSYTVNNHLSKASWLLFVFINYLKGILVSYKLINLVMVSKVRRLFTRNHTYKKPNLHFANLRKNNLPSGSNGPGSRTIINWYTAHFGLQSTNTIVSHNVKESKPYKLQKLRIIPSDYPYSIQLSFKKSFFFAIWVVTAQIVSLADLIRGAWWTPLLLADAAEAALVRFTSENLLPSEYLFNNSSRFRPLWTYEVEQKGSRVSYYFYSTNSDGFDKQNETDKRFSAYYDMDWSNYLVWDAAQAEFVKKCVSGSPNIDIVGPIDFSDCTQTISQIQLKPYNERKVAVFDVTPYRKAFVYLELMHNEYYNFNVVSKFITDINEVIEDVSATILYKQKRDISNFQEPRYKHLIQRIAQNKYFNKVHSCIAASRVIEQSEVVISIPFTSTAIIGQSLNKPSIYYDPTGELDLNHPSAHGIPILGNKSLLKEWLNEQFHL